MESKYVDIIERCEEISFKKSEILQKINFSLRPKG